MFRYYWFCVALHGSQRVFVLRYSNNARGSRHMFIGGGFYTSGAAIACHEKKYRTRKKQRQRGISDFSVPELPFAA